MKRPNGDEFKEVCAPKTVKIKLNLTPLGEEIKNSEI